MVRIDVRSGARSLMPVYEDNYRRLLGLVPHLRSISKPTTLMLCAAPDIRMRVIECCKYTSTVILAHCLATEGRLVPDLLMKIRLYHDAQLAEVIGYQNQSRFDPLFSSCEGKVRYPLEKRRVNLFLGEWLRYRQLDGGRIDPRSRASKA